MTGRSKLPWVARKLANYTDPGHVLLWPDKGGEHMRRVDYRGNFTEADAEFITLACNNHDQLVRTLQFMLAYENDDESALGEIQEAWNQQEEVKDANEFARCYCARKMRAALTAAGAL